MDRHFGNLCSELVRWGCGLAERGLGWGWLGKCVQEGLGAVWKFLRVAAVSVWF